MRSVTLHGSGTNAILASRAIVQAVKIAEGLRFAALDELLSQMRSSSLPGDVTQHFIDLLTERAKGLVNTMADTTANEALALGRHDEAMFFAEDIEVATYTSLLDGNTCLLPGTMVLTDDGERPVEGLAVGDRLRTGDGWARIGAIHPKNAVSAVALYVGGRVLRVTADHPILVGRRWVEAGRIRRGDFVFSDQPREVGAQGSAIVSKVLGYALDAIARGSRGLPLLLVARLDHNTSMRIRAVAFDEQMGARNLEIERANLRDAPWRTRRVRRVEHYPYAGIVYDITLDAGHTFFADGILVHNCDPCSDADGVSVEFGSSEYARLKPPYRECDSAAAPGGNRCRCQFVFTLKTEARGEGLTTGGARHLRARRARGPV